MPPEQRRRLGAYFTPAPLVRLLLERVGACAPKRGRLAVVDPACGGGAFLAAARERLPRAELFGLELSEELAARCRERVSGAKVLCGDALRGGLEPLLEQVPAGAFELWVGNPPYNGTSPVLGDKEAYRRLCALLPEELPKGTSLRDDYAFFLLVAAKRLERARGALAFVTSSTFLDAFMYAPLRRALLASLCLREVVELGRGAFRGTRVRTCITVWSASPQRRPVLYRGRATEGEFEPGQLGRGTLFHPGPPEWLLRPPRLEAEELDRQWRERGQLLSELLPVSLSGLKTRFDELLVDADPARLLARVDDFLKCPKERLEAFAEAWGIPARCFGKLVALKRAQPPGFTKAEPEALRPFYRYAGARHRGVIPAEARACCYLDRRLIPRGDHRLRGEYDPHACRVKLVFNARELPLCAAMLEENGCVHDHRHARFAPLFVPQVVLEGGLGAARAGGKLGREVPNLSVRGLGWAKELGGPLEAFRAICAFINSSPVQEVWAPAFGASRELPVPLS
ncbi:MAG: N-6 DNA methylase [Myxococcales bacterium]|nr:N-6 DNA methylase [Myxococcales bacterium]